MGPDFWTTFTFFGIPLCLGVLGVARGLRLCVRGYRQYRAVPVPGQSPVDTDSADSERSWRENLAIGVALVLGAGLLVAHSGRWLLRLL